MLITFFVETATNVRIYQHVTALNVITKTNRWTTANTWKVLRWVECAALPATAAKAIMESQQSFNAPMLTAQNTLKAMDRRRSVWDNTTELIAVQLKMFAVSHMTWIKYYKLIISWLFKLDDDVDKLSTCEFEGETYREGQAMYPKEHCYKCFCTKNFNNKMKVEENENCQKIECGISLRNVGRVMEGCIPGEDFSRGH